jgi:phage tail-like protein
MVMQLSPTNGKVAPGYLMEYLPAIYRESEFIGQFLHIFEDILGPLESTVDNLALYLDPSTTPEPMLPWLATWVGISLDESWPLERRRALVKSAADLYRWRGTKRGLSEYLRIYTGHPPVISEFIQGMRLDSGTQLGVNTRLGSSGSGHHFTVVVETGSAEGVSQTVVRAIIDSMKPAHTVYTLQMKGR